MKNINLLLICFCFFCYGQEGTLDSTFNTNNTNYYYANFYSSMVVQSDNKILIADDKDSTTNGQPIKSIYRVNSDGTVDSSFSVGNTFDLFLINNKKFIGIQNDGKIIVAGNTTTGATMIRLNTDGSVDTNFITPYSGITAMKILSNGMILIAVSDHRIYRYNSDGILDSTFSITDMGFPITAFAEQSDGKIIVAGEAGTIKRINGNGGGIFTMNSYLNYITSISIQNDGKIVAAGRSGGTTSTTLSDVIRINSDGSIDPTLSVDVFWGNNVVQCMYLQPNNSIIIGGSFTTINGINCRHLERVFDDGSIDYSFNPGGAGPVNTPTGIMPLSDNRLMVKGVGNSYNGIGVGNLIRLNAINPLETDDFLNSSFSLSPNPTKNLFNIDSNVQPDKIEVYNALGKFIGTSNDLSSQATGIYIVKIYSMDKVVIKKVIKS